MPKWLEGGEVVDIQRNLPNLYRVGLVVRVKCNNSTSFYILNQAMKIDSRLLESTENYPHVSSYKSCYNVRGQYDSMQFVLRLRYDLHKALEEMPNQIISSSKIDEEAFQAYSTYLHETIHWWQHIGSISGLILSLSYPAQAHINHKHLLDFLKSTGPIKPIKRYNELNATEFIPTTEEFKTINLILNNFNDIEFFKHFTINPSSRKLMESIIEDPMYESLGHTYYIAYSSFIQVLSSTFDQKMEFLPRADQWHLEIDKLRSEDGSVFNPRSDVKLTPIGLRELYEGQARFTQLQFLYFGSGENITWQEFEEKGMFSGFYYTAFSEFLEIIKERPPKSIGSPLVALFLLIVDIAINPTEGFPFDIFEHEFFVLSVDPGIRFIMLCKAVAEKFPEFKNKITAYSSNEYAEISTSLSKEIYSFSPLDAAQEVCSWAQNKPVLAQIMKEEEKFNFSPENMPIRLIFSRFIRFQRDKLSYPAFFCWPGAYMAGSRGTQREMNLFLEHQALFFDKSDGDVYPKIFADKNESNVQETFNNFYAWVASYDLCRQWISHEGSFDYDYFWLTSKYSRDALENWAKHYFEQNYGISPDKFKVIS